MKINLLKKITTVGLVVAFALTTAFTSCKKTNIVKTDNLPEEVLPASLRNEIMKYMDIYEGTTPPDLEGQFVSRPHMLFHASYNPEEDSTLYFDRYVAFTYSSSNGIDFYGKQWDDSLVDAQGNYYAGYYEEHVSKLKITGSGDYFSCYYLTEGYPNGMYAKQSTIFSGQWIKGSGLKNFKVAVILLETSGNPNLEEPNSFRILGDADGLAEVENWMGKSSQENYCIKENAFNAFRKK